MAAIVDIRRGEWLRTVIAASVLLCVVGSYQVVKAVRDALFLAKYGISALSLLYVGLAVLTSFVVSVYVRGTLRAGERVVAEGLHRLVPDQLVRAVDGGVLAARRTRS